MSLPGGSCLMKVMVVRVQNKQTKTERREVRKQVGKLQNQVVSNDTRGRYHEAFAAFCRFAGMNLQQLASDVTKIDTVPGKLHWIHVGRRWTKELRQLRSSERPVSHPSSQTSFTVQLETHCHLEQVRNAGSGYALEPFYGDVVCWADVWMGLPISRKHDNGRL